MKTEEFSKYEKARIIGARGLQIAMDAPLLKQFKKEELEATNYDPLRLAEQELESGVLPITVNKPLPQKREEDIEKIKVEETKMTDEEKEKTEKEEEKEIAESGEILQLAKSEEDDEEETTEEDIREELE